MIDLNIEQKQLQTLSMNQQQALQLLALPLSELRVYLEQQLRDYPLIEIRGKEPESLSAYLEDHETPPSAYEKGDKADPLLFLKSPQTFTEDLLLQLSAQKLPARLEKCCTYIIYSLSPRGYLLDNEEDISAQTGFSIEDVRQAVYVVQSLLPAGVGAHDLSECLVLQLVNSRQFNMYTIRIVKDHLDDLAACRYSKISSALGISRQEAEYWCAHIRKLNPIPSRGYASGEYIQYFVPEAAVDSDLSIIMNKENVPHLTVAKEYQEMLRRPLEAGTKTFLRDTSKQACTLNSHIHYRQQTIEGVISCIVALQPQYFRGSKVNLRPMTMQQIADMLSLNISTISRAVSGKYITTVHGSIPLRGLFTASVSDAVSAGSVKVRIRELIRLEDKNSPLSDEALCHLLQAEQINISRRTAAKYRAELGIPASSMRRKVSTGL